MLKEESSIHIEGILDMDDLSTFCWFGLLNLSEVCTGHFCDYTGAW